VRKNGVRYRFTSVRIQDDAEIKATLQPGQNGTKALLRKYGDRLVCVRYRYDKAKLKRYTTVELIVEENDWFPGKVSLATPQVVLIRVGYDEKALREQVKAAGGRWKSAEKAWELPYQAVVALGLKPRILGSAAGG